MKLLSLADIRRVVLMLDHDTDLTAITSTAVFDVRADRALRDPLFEHLLLTSTGEVCEPHGSILLQQANGHLHMCPYVITRFVVWPVPL